MKNLKRFPFHPIFFCMNPVLALLVTNISEVEFGVVLRPLLLAVAGTIFLLGLLRLPLKDIRKAALVTSLLLILFFTYGHVYQLVELKQIFGMNVGRHRYLILLYAVLGLGGLWLILRKVKDYVYTTRVFNIVGLLLLLVPFVQIVTYKIRLTSVENAAKELKFASTALNAEIPKDPPDIYYIILDTYTRGDALQRDLNFDNSAFIEELRGLGFYVAECSRSNYSYTQGTITAALNLEYLTDLEDDLDELGLGMNDIWVLMKQSLVRRKLEEIGYKTVAFDTGYEWSQIGDADLYYGVGSSPFSLQTVTPFEAMLLRSTAVLLLADSRSWFFTERLRNINFPHAEYVQTQLFILDQLGELPAIEGPIFVFAHVLIPHVPYVFDPEGNLRQDPGYFGDEFAGPINEHYLQDGYTGEIQFINSKILKIVKKIFEASQPSPIIIIHGDHGLRDENRLQIMNAYYLPEGGNAGLYPSISPVNSFRIVFDTYFGTNYGFVVDESFFGDDFGHPIPEYSPECQSILGETP